MRALRRCWACWHAAAAAAQSCRAAAAARCRDPALRRRGRWPPLDQTPPTAACRPAPALAPSVLPPAPAACRVGPPLWGASPPCSAWPATTGWAAAAAAPLCLGGTTATAPACQTRCVGGVPARCCALHGLHPLLVRLPTTTCACDVSPASHVAVNVNLCASAGGQGQRGGCNCGSGCRGGAHQFCQPAPNGRHAGIRWAAAEEACRQQPGEQAQGPAGAARAAAGLAAGGL